MNSRLKQNWKGNQFCCSGWTRRTSSLWTTKWATSSTSSSTKSSPICTAAVTIETIFYENKFSTQQLIWELTFDCRSKPRIPRGSCRHPLSCRWHRRVLPGKCLEAEQSWWGCLTCCGCCEDVPWFGGLGGVIIFVGIVMVVVMGLMADFISESDRGKGLPRTSLFTKLCRTYAMS